MPVQDTTHVLCVVQRELLCTRYALFVSALSRQTALIDDVLTRWFHLRQRSASSCSAWASTRRWSSSSRLLVSRR